MKEGTYSEKLPADAYRKGVSHDCFRPLQQINSAFILVWKKIMRLDKATKSKTALFGSNKVNMPINFKDYKYIKTSELILNAHFS